MGLAPSSKINVIITVTEVGKGQVEYNVKANRQQLVLDKKGFPKTKTEPLTFDAVNEIVQVLARTLRSGGSDVPSVIHAALEHAV